jgi:ubiquilin
MGSFGMPPRDGGEGGAAASNPWANPAMGPNGPNLEATLQMMENPMMQNMMQNMLNNPEAMRMMMESNPMIQQLRQTNPQAAAIFENPQAVRS